MNLKELLGSWTLARTILGNTQEEIAQMHGQAEWTPHAKNELHYQEHVTHKTEKNQYVAYREYLYKVTKDTLQIFLINEHYSPQKLFAAFPLKSLTTYQARHPCRNDTYLIQFPLFSSTKIIQEISVTGPAKDYTIQTTYSRRHECS